MKGNYQLQITTAQGKWQAKRVLLAQYLRCTIVQLTGLRLYFRHNHSNGCRECHAQNLDMMASIFFHLISRFLSSSEPDTSHVHSRIWSCITIPSTDSVVSTIPPTFTGRQSPEWPWITQCTHFQSLLFKMPTTLNPPFLWNTDILLK